MSTYFMFGDYSPASLEDISADRTEKAAALVKKLGGEIQAGYALLGAHDLVLIADFADAGQAMRASVALTKMLGISFTTSPAVSVEEFDKLMEGV